MKRSSLFSLVILLVLFFSCAENVDIEAEKTAVKSILNQYLRAWASDDVDLFSEIISHDNDMVNYWTMASDRFVGWEELKKKFQEPAWFSDSKFEVDHQVIKVHSSGKVAWFSEVINWDYFSQEQQRRIEGLRFTGILEKQNEKWVFVQTHFSIPSE